MLGWLGWVTSDCISRGLRWVTENGPTAMSVSDCTGLTMLAAKGEIGGRRL